MQWRIQILQCAQDNTDPEVSLLKIFNLAFHFTTFKTVCVMRHIFFRTSFIPCIMLYIFFFLLYIKHLYTILSTVSEKCSTTQFFPLKKGHFFLQKLKGHLIYNISFQSLIVYSTISFKQIIFLNCNCLNCNC